MALGELGGLGLKGTSSSPVIFPDFHIDTFSVSIDEESSSLYIKKDMVSAFVYKGRNSTIKLNFSYADEPVKFLDEEVIKIGVVLDGQELSSESDYIHYDNEGVITFDLDSIPNPPKNKTLVRVIAYRSDEDKGTPIITERTKSKIEFNFI